MCIIHTILFPLSFFLRRTVWGRPGINGSSIFLHEEFPHSPVMSRDILKIESEAEGSTFFFSDNRLCDISVSPPLSKSIFQFRRWVSSICVIVTFLVIMALLRSSLTMVHAMWVPWQHNAQSSGIFFLLWYLVWKTKLTTKTGRCFLAHASKFTLVFLFRGKPR